MDLQREAKPCYINATAGISLDSKLQSWLEIDSEKVETIQ